MPFRIVAQQAKSNCVRPSTFLGRLDVSGQTLNFGHYEFGEVQAGTFGVALRFFLVELSRTNPFSVEMRMGWSGTAPPKRRAAPHGKFLPVPHRIHNDQNQGFVVKRRDGRERSTAVSSYFWPAGRQYGKASFERFSALLSFLFVVTY